MFSYLKKILDWSEAWAPLIPLFILSGQRNQPRLLKPVVIYILIAFPINLLGDIIGDFKQYFPGWLHQNTYLYNTHSVIRFVCFSYFFISLEQEYYKLLKKIIPFIYAICLSVDLIFYENFFDKNSIGSNILTMEAFLLLVYCLLYYLSKLKNENDSVMSGADFYVVTGLSIFVVTNFFVFLLYDSVLSDSRLRNDWRIADNMWLVHNVAYIIFCLLIAKAFSLAKKHNTAVSK